MKSIIDLDEYTVIKWRMTEMCNFSCPYCIRRPFREDIEKSAKRLKREALFIAGIKTDRPVKIDMIGGEVSLLPLEDIYSVLRGKIDRVQITTNTSKPASFYNNLNDIIETSLMCSWHKCGISFEDYKKTVEQLKVANLTLEMVSTKDNQEDCKRFISAFKDKFEIMVDLDRSSPNNADLSLIHFTNKKRHPRYRYGDKIYYSKPELLADLGDGTMVDTLGQICDQTHYVYVCNGKFSCPSDEIGQCCDHYPIEGHSINEALRKKRCTLSCCTLCGHMSVIQ